MSYIDRDYRSNSWVVKTRTQESVRLTDVCEDSTITPDGRQTRDLAGPGKLRVRTSFYWPPCWNDPDCVTAGYTSPLARWVQTEILGLVASKIVLKGTFSQSYIPGHHNFLEYFMFEPRLEQGIDQSIIDQLAAKNIQALHIFADKYRAARNVYHVLGLDGTFREL